MLELQARLTGCFGQRFHAAVILITAAIVDNFFDTFIACALGDCFTNDFRGGNISAAVRKTFPNEQRTSGAVTQIGILLMRTPEMVRIKGNVEEMAGRALAHAAERFGATADRAAEELTRIAFAQVRDVADWSTTADPADKARTRQVLTFRDSADISPDVHRAITEVTSRADGTVTIKLGDKQAALMNLARLRGWIADKPEQPNHLVSLVIQR